MIAARWVNDLWMVPEYRDHGPDRRAVVEVLGHELPDGDDLLPPKVKRGGAVDLVCDNRGHLLGRVYPTSEGLLLWVIYDSGRSTRRMEDGTVLRTLKYRDGRPFLINGEMPGSDARCDCTTVQMTAETRRALSAIATRRPKCVKLPSALCPMS